MDSVDAPIVGMLVSFAVIAFCTFLSLDRKGVQWAMIAGSVSGICLQLAIIVAFGAW